MYKVDEIQGMTNCVNSCDRNESALHVTNRIAVARASRYNFAAGGTGRIPLCNPLSRSTCREVCGIKLGREPDTRKARRMGTNQTISDRSLVVAKDQVSCDLAGQAAIPNIKSGVYYGLDPVGARIWTLMQEPREVSEIQKHNYRRV